jgi:hypothetical protein
VERMFSFMNGATAYIDAAGKYSEDDELHACKRLNADSLQIL